MIDDRDYLLFKLLCRLSDKSSLHSTHGIVYVKGSMIDGEAQLDNQAGWNFSYLSDRVRCQISESDLIVKLSNDSFAVILHSTSEEKLRISTQSFQSLFLELPATRSKWTIAVGAVLFNQVNTTIPELIGIAYENAFESSSENRIVYTNLTHQGATYMPGASEAA
ncbi:MAG: hypothetical protein AB8B79_09270 [Granulosicoccus sp.]